MVSFYVHTLLFLFWLRKISLGQPADGDGLLVSEISIRPSSENDSRHNFSISFQLKKVPTDGDDGFEKRELKFAILDKIEQQRLDEKSIVFDNSSTKTMNYDGKYFGLRRWMKSANGKQIQMDGYFDKNANGTVFLVEGMEISKLKQRLVYRRIIFDDKIKLNVFIKISRGEKADEVNAGSVVTVFCKAHSTKYVKPKFEGLQFLNQTIKTNQTNKEIQATFRVEKENHSKMIWCVAGKARQFLTIKVLHAPADVRITPGERYALVAGSHLRCSAVDGYPPPTVTWLTTSVPPNGDKFYHINQTTNSLSTFILKDDVPVGSVWMITCRSTNRLGNVSITVNFTAEGNETWLLSRRLSKLEVSLQQLQDENTQKVLVQNQSNLETKMEKLMENMQKVFIQQQSNLEKKIENKLAIVEMMLEIMIRQHETLKAELKATREDAAVLRELVDETTQELVKTNEGIQALSSKAKNDKSAWQKEDDDLGKVLQEIRQMMNTSRRIQEISVGRLDELAVAVKVDWFVWRIEGISGKLNTDIFSRPFYSDGTRGYKLRLYFFVSSHGHTYSLMLVFYLMRGDDDDRLQWPMQRTVLFEILDEQSTFPIMSQRVSQNTKPQRIDDVKISAYIRPIRESNINDVGDGFIWDRPIVPIRNDSITVRCRVLPR